jgi:hypothetical protein
MTPTFVAWGAAALLLVILAVAIGRKVTRHPLGLLIDGRGRYSLTQTQLALWSITILSLIAGVFIGRLVARLEPFGFDIPATVLGLMGITLGSSLLSSAQKSSANTQGTPTAGAPTPSPSTQVAASIPVAPWRPSLQQIFLSEQGPFADQVVDMTKFQNFVITIVVLIAYVSIAVMSLSKAGTPASFTGLPDISGTLLTLLGISHAAYLGGKLPPASGDTAGLNTAGRSYLANGLLAGSGKMVGALWSTPVAVYALGSPPPASVTVGSNLIVTSSQDFMLGVATTFSAPNGPVSTRADLPAAQIAGSQWASVIPASMLSAAGQLTIQGRAPGQAGPGPVAGAPAAIQIPLV